MVGKGSNLIKLINGSHQLRDPNLRVGYHSSTSYVYVVKSHWWTAKLGGGRKLVGRTANLVSVETKVIGPAKTQTKTHFHISFDMFHDNLLRRISLHNLKLCLFHFRRYFNRHICEIYDPC